MSHKPQYTEPVHEHIEEWHHHTSDEGLPQVEHGAKPNILLLMFAFVGSVGFVGLTILATYLYFSHYTAGLRRKLSENTALNADFRQYQADVQKKLHDGYVWLNDDAARAGRVTLPIAAAQERVIARYQK